MPEQANHFDKYILGSGYRQYAVERRLYFYSAPGDFIRRNC